MIKPRSPRAVAPDLLERLKARFGAFPLTREWDLSIDAVTPGATVLSLEPSATTTNGPAGVVNGGVLATLADMACALALSTRFDGRMPFATSDLHIRYLEPAQSRVTVTAALLRVSLRSAILDCRLSCGEHLVALGSAHFILNPSAKDAE